MHPEEQMDQHWSRKVLETTFSFAPFAQLHVSPIPISGGSENGQFCQIGERVQHDKLIYHTGPNSKLRSGDLILEVQGQKVAGYTSHDLREWILSVGQNSTPVLIKCAKAGKCALTISRGLTLCVH